MAEGPAISSGGGLLKERFEEMKLTRQERRIAMMLLDGGTDQAICGALFITKNTLKFHIRNINRKLKIRNRRELPSIARQLMCDDGLNRDF